MKFTAVLTVRDEAAFLLEWIAHHHAIGFTDFLVFSNDCSDGTDAMLDRLAELGMLTHVPNPGPYAAAGIQWTALKQADKHPLVRGANWLMCIDIDEFVNIHTGDGTLSALLDALPQATAIPLTWRLFGNAGVDEYIDAPITEQFQQAAPAVLHWPWRAAMFKTLFKNDGIYGKMGVHRPRSPDKSRLDEVIWMDTRGQEIRDPAIKTRRLFSSFGRDNYPLAQLNHYALGAKQSYVMKRARGRVNRADAGLGMDYWVERNFNQSHDNSILRHKDKSAPILSELRADPTLSKLHEQAVAWRKSTFETLLREEENRAIYGRLLMTPPSEPIAPSKAKELMSYRIGAKKQNTPE
ncbi:glycosyltransferase family 2 protein [Falsihalocynthiibacter sp. SS001]|uniref:glycosyltransferase family 2 protein n=1 Tax=Falsihalocynthiibacter sp. SS001 TaxID=3349698 RepID=UPI0036D27814